MTYKMCILKNTGVDMSEHLSPTGSKRLNVGKPEIGQLDPRFLLDLAHLLTQSSVKYGKFNYVLGQEYHTPFDSLMRHSMAFWSGEDLDKESKLSHVLHMAANCMILYSSILTQNKALDTRFPGFKALEDNNQLKESNGALNKE